LGGIVIRIGDKVYDGSVQGKLLTLRRAVASGVEKAIRDQYASLLS
ncbi:MAG: F0F1 ATP synthase subunit delta, partial [Pirellulaceae bacterium]|nr:F0F1 ATP synthase subunit delta [Pirellulaceae bacterium]